MFVLFGELKKKQELCKVMDLGIGVGLSSSKELCEALGGSVRLVSSKKGST
jgi:signal transduction histidine kinase